MKIFAIVLAVFILAVAGSAYAGNIDNAGLQIPDRNEGTRTIVNYTDYTNWSAAVGGSIAENRYAELGDGVLVTTQYQAVGATYTDGDDYTMSYPGGSTDGMILNGNGRVHITFSYPLTAVGVNFPGAVRIYSYMGTQLVFQSDDFGGSGTGFFGGVVSDTQFDRVEIMDWVDDMVFVDDVFYNAEGTATQTTTWGEIRSLYR